MNYKINSSKFRIANFCNEHNKEFKIYYNYLNNPFYVSIILKCLQYMNHEQIKNKVFKMIVNNHDIVLDKLNKIDIIISFYKENNLINKSEIGKFFQFYEKEKVKIRTSDNKDLLKLFYKLIYYPNCISVLKECFYIFSDYRSCIYFMTPSINFYDTKKENVEKVIKNFKDNINTLNQIISKVYLGEKNPWGSKYYSSSYAMFETLFILKKYYKDPLKKLNIIIKINEKEKKINLIKELCISYHKLKMKNSDIDDKISNKYINNVSQFLVNLKRLGYDMWFTIVLIFNVIYKDYEIKNVENSITFGYKKIYYQKMNNTLGIMCYLLVEDGYITNVNNLKHFND